MAVLAAFEIEGREAVVVSDRLRRRGLSGMDRKSWPEMKTRRGLVYVAGYPCRHRRVDLRRKLGCLRGRGGHRGCRERLGVQENDAGAGMVVTMRLTRLIGRWLCLRDDLGRVEGIEFTA